MMNAIRSAIAAMLALCTLPETGHAAKPEPIDAKATYVLVEIHNPPDVTFMGVTVPGMLTLARYDADHGDIKGGYQAAASALPKGEMVRVQMGMKTRSWVKTKTSRLYLIKIVPDLWVIEGASGTSYSLGSLTFTAKPGEIIDLGVAEARVDLAGGEKQENFNTGSLLKTALFPFARMPEPKKNRLDLRARTAGDLPLPKELEGRALTLPQFSYGATFGNYAGGLVNRIDGQAGRGRAAGPVISPPADRVPVPPQ
ncbi:MAG: hypothetical protein RL367_2400 [Pseudomonadota bacterium]